MDILLESESLDERSTIGKVKDFLTGKNVPPRKSREKPEKKAAVRKPGDVWKTKSNTFGAMSSRKTISYHSTRAAAEKFSKS